MAKDKKKSIEKYDHADKSRKNNPPVGLVTPDNDRDAEAKTYAYDPHLDPTLQWVAGVKVGEQVTEQCSRPDLAQRLPGDLSPGVQAE